MKCNHKSLVLSKSQCLSAEGFSAFAGRCRQLNLTARGAIVQRRLSDCHRLNGHWQASFGAQHFLEARRSRYSLKIWDASLFKVIFNRKIFSCQDMQSFFWNLGVRPSPLLWALDILPTEENSPQVFQGKEGELSWAAGFTSIQSKKKASARL